VTHDERRDAAVSRLFYRKDPRDLGGSWWLVVAVLAIGLLGLGLVIGIAVSDGGLAAVPTPLAILEAKGER
jgi:hypothetical protein